MEKINNIILICSFIFALFVSFVKYVLFFIFIIFNIHFSDTSINIINILEDLLYDLFLISLVAKFIISKLK